MALTISERFKKAWNVFANKDPTNDDYWDRGMAYSLKPDRVHLTIVSERTFLASVKNRIAVDVSSFKFQHIETDQNGIYQKTLNTGLNDCLSVEANKDQSGRDFLRDAALSLVDEGCIALVPVITSLNPDRYGGYDIYSIRTAPILEWRPNQVRVKVYDDNDGISKEIWCNKKNVAIIENPFYAVMNEPNSTLQRLNHKLALLDKMDQTNSSGKLDMIIQLPYTLKSERKKEEARSRTKEIEMQLTSSPYGIAYVDAAERITQMNRPVTNSLLDEIRDLKAQALNELNMTEALLNGSANEQEITNYFTRTVGPIVQAILDGMNRSFLTKTARTQGKIVMAFRDVFAYVPPTSLATMLVNFKREEIITGNEARSYLAMLPSNDPRADELRNANVSSGNDQLGKTPSKEETMKGDNQNEV